MIKKLMKHELRATSRYFLPVYLALALTTVLAMAGSQTARDAGIYGMQAFFIAVCAAAYVAAAVAVIVVTIAACVHRFYSSLLTDEGYLSFTLPVTPAQHIWSKLVVSALWIVCSMVGLGLSLTAVMLVGQGQAPDVPNAAEWRQFWAYLSDPLVWRSWLLAVVLFVVTLVHLVMLLYASTAVGNFLPKHRLLVGIAFFFGFVVLECLAVFMLSVTVGLPIAGYGSDYTREIFYGVVAVWELGALAFQGLCTTLLFLFTNYVLKHKLNLE